MRIPVVLAGLIFVLPASAQDDDLLKLLGEEEVVPEYTNASFKTTRVINAHSLENTAHGVLDFKIGHRFGFINGGVNDFFGLDGATVRLGLDYGVTERLMIGIGRSSYQKTVDGFAKYKFLRQCNAGCEMPITLALVAASSINTTQKSDFWPDTSMTYYASHRMAYSFMLLIGRKFNESLSFQLNPGVVHRNLVATAEEANDVFHISGAGRMKLNKRVALNAEYFHVLAGQTRAPVVPPERADDPNPGYKNSFSIGFDIETGGHVFQLHFTNSTAMFERGFITETLGNWADGDIHFGFNISRVFTMHNPKKPKS
jgi:hypothetical protein